MEWRKNWERSFFAWVCFINKLFAQLARRVVQLSRRREQAEGKEGKGAGYKFTCKIGTAGNVRGRGGNGAWDTSHEVRIVDTGPKASYCCCNCSSLVVCSVVCAKVVLNLL